MNAADTYGVEDLRAACFEFALRFITLKTVLRLLVSADMYSDYKGTKAVVAKVRYLTSYLHALLDWSSWISNLTLALLFVILVWKDIKQKPLGTHRICKGHYQDSCYFLTKSYWNNEVKKLL